MGALIAISRVIDRLTRAIGYNVRWLVLVAILISAVNAIVRKVFDTSSNAWLELQWLLFGAVFLLAASYTLKNNAHVRIDVVAGGLRKRTRDWIDLFGHLFMLAPITLIMIWLSGPFFWQSYQEGEVSTNAGGLPVWPAKLFILAGFSLLFLQMLSEAIKRTAVLAGAIEDAHSPIIHDHEPGNTSPSRNRGE
jgi:TRAP-type mannitol/chloroaromatic compound transport system permease small subunit